MRQYKKIQVLNNCYEDDFFHKLARCYAVIVPLAETQISSGQLVVLQSLMYGKPVIVTRNNTISEYVNDGVDGYIIGKDEDALDKAIENVRKNYTLLSHNARDSYEQKYSLYAMGSAIGTVIKRK